MKPLWPFIRIAAALTVIFTSGVWVGKQTNTLPSVPLSEDARIKKPSAAQLKRATRRVLRRYQEELNLTQAQVATIRPFVVQTSMRMEVLPPYSQARLGVVRDFHKEISPFLTEEQLPGLSKIYEEASRSKDTQSN